MRSNSPSASLPCRSELLQPAPWGIPGATRVLPVHTPTANAAAHRLPQTDRRRSTSATSKEGFIVDQSSVSFSAHRWFYRPPLSIPTLTQVAPGTQLKAVLQFTSSSILRQLLCAVDDYDSTGPRAMSTRILRFFLLAIDTVVAVSVDICLQCDIVLLV